MRGSKYKYVMTLFLVYLYIHFKIIKNLSLEIHFDSSANKYGDGLITFMSPDHNGKLFGGGNYQSFDELPASTTTTTTPSRMEALIQELEQQVTMIRYYVYDDHNMTLPVVRQKALQNSKP